MRRASRYPEATWPIVPFDGKRPPPELVRVPGLTGEIPGLGGMSTVTLPLAPAVMPLLCDMSSGALLLDAFGNCREVSRLSRTSVLV